MFRREGETTGFGAANEGMVELMMLPGGGFLVREVLSTGTFNNLYSGNPFGLGGSIDNTYSMPGQLPDTVNGMPFDANSNGVLEDGEQFQLSASLIGNTFDVSVNGLNVISGLTTTLSEPVNRKSTLGLYKNRYTGAGGLDSANMAYDNLVISGTEFVPPPLGPIKHTGDTDPIDENWSLSATGTVVNNGPVDDGGTAAWNIEADGTGRASWLRALEGDEPADALSEGWTYKATVKVLGVDDAVDGGIELSVSPDSPLNYILWLGSDAEGNTLVAEYGGDVTGDFGLQPTVTLPGQDYVDYEMVFDPVSQTVDVFADNNLIIEDMLPLDRGTTSLNAIRWGSNSGSAPGNANYASVEFIIGDGPEMLVGDYNEDGIVNLADYTVWRDSLGSTEPLANDAIGGTIGAVQYEQWKTHFGENNNNLLVGDTSVPEPSTMALVFLGFVALAGGVRRLQ